MCQPRRGSLGSPRFRRPRLFPCAGRRKFSFDRSPEQIAQVHPLVLEILFRVPSLSLPPAPFREQADCQGSCPLRDVTGCVHHLEGSQVLDVFRPQVLSTSRRLSPQAGSTGLFHPAAASRAFARSGGFLLLAAIVSSSGRPAPLPLLDSRSPGRILTATAGDLGFEALIRAGARNHGVGS